MARVSQQGEQFTGPTPETDFKVQNQGRIWVSAPLFFKGVPRWGEGSSFRVSTMLSRERSISYKAPRSGPFLSPPPSTLTAPRGLLPLQEDPHPTACAPVLSAQETPPPSLPTPPHGSSPLPSGSSGIPPSHPSPSSAQLLSKTRLTVHCYPVSFLIY